MGAGVGGSGLSMPSGPPTPPFANLLPAWGPVKKGEREAGGGTIGFLPGERASGVGEKRAHLPTLCPLAEGFVTTPVVRWEGELPLRGGTALSPLHEATPSVGFTPGLRKLTPRPLCIPELTVHPLLADPPASTLLSAELGGVCGSSTSQSPKAL